jgi:isochorismate synthase
VLPRVLVRSAEGRCAVTVWGSSSDDASALLERHRAGFGSAAVRRPGPARGRRVADSRERALWEAGVRAALEAIGRDEVRKVVLARRTRVEAAAALDPLAVVAALEHRVERSAPFLLDFGEGAAFAGASPERLIRARGGGVESECIAGTAARGRTVEEDQAQAAAVLGSEKDRREHDYVVQAVREAFERYCRDVQIDAEAALLTLSSVHHLKLTARGRLREEGDLAGLLAALHPTPAVGGTPRGRALEILRRAEGESRGWYAGPVGWIEPSAAEFVVAIRSAVIEGRSAKAFAGSGIVEGSDPEAEWQETEAKLAPMIAALKGEGA